MEDKKRANDARILKLIVEDSKVGDHADPMLLPDEMRGKYEVGNVLGKGSFGCVFKAKKTVVGRAVAFKILLPSRGGTFSEREQRRLIREAKVLQSLQCEHAVEIIDADFSMNKDRFFIMMELLEGVDMEVYLKEHGPIDSLEAIALGMNVLEVLIELHAQGIAHRLHLLAQLPAHPTILTLSPPPAHRDIKPANIMRCLPSHRAAARADGRAPAGAAYKLLDFGLALGVDPDVADAALQVHFIENMEASI